VTSPLIEATHLVKSYGHVQALDDVNLAVDAGEVVVIIGPSGSGKTSLIRTLNGLETIDSGRIVVDGTCLQDPTEPTAMRRAVRQEVRRELGMVFQRFNLFPHLTALGNVTLAPQRVRGLSKREAEERGMSLLRDMGLEKKALNFPHELSGGQQQRVAIARALAMQPKAMLFDEATSALDPELVGEVLRVMRKLAADGMTMIIVTHEMHFAAQVAHRLVVMDEGRVIETGEPQEVFNAPKEERTARFVRAVLEPESMGGVASEHR